MATWQGFVSAALVLGLQVCPIMPGFFFNQSLSVGVDVCMCMHTCV